MLTFPRMARADVVAQSVENASDNTFLGSIVVNAAEGFAISGIHKFNLFKRGERVMPEYCAVCSAARRLLRIDGEDIDYVANVLNKHKGWSVEKYDHDKASEQLSKAIVKEYQRLNKES